MPTRPALALVVSAACVSLGYAPPVLAQGAPPRVAKQASDATGLELLRNADQALRNAPALAFTIRREGSGAQATREPATTARVVISRTDGATRGGLLDKDDKPQWQVAAFGVITSSDGEGDRAPFAFAIDGDKARYVDPVRIALVEADHAYTDVLITDSGAWTALQWLTEWETLVGNPIVDDTPREHPRLDGNVLIGEDGTNAIYVDLAEFPNTYAFGAWWYLGVSDNLPRRLEMVYYDVRDDEKMSVGDGISRLTISDIHVLDTPADVAAAVTRAASLLNETNWRQPGETPIAELLDADQPFTLPAPDDFETIAYQPPAGQRQAQRPAEPELNIPAPDFTLLDPEGNEHTLSSYQGKIVIIDFWATWCGPCLMVMPDLNAIHQQYKDQGVVVMGVNAWENGDPAALMKARNWDYLLLLGGDQVAAQYQVGSIPTMVVVDQSGMIVKRHVGASPDIKAELTETITKLQGQN
ncbi:MAG: TlpA family protein disulfide reductase [Phycisphaerales bacterium JB064]